MHQTVSTDLMCAWIYMNHKRSLLPTLYLELACPSVPSLLQVCHNQSAVCVWAGALRPDILPDAVWPQRRPVSNQPLPLFPFLPFLQQKELLCPLHPGVQPAEPQQQEPGGPRQTEVRALTRSVEIQPACIACYTWPVFDNRVCVFVCRLWWHMHWWLLCYIWCVCGLLVGLVLCVHARCLCVSFLIICMWSSPSHHSDHHITDRDTDLWKAALRDRWDSN